MSGPQDWRTTFLSQITAEIKLVAQPVGIGSPLGMAASDGLLVRCLGPLHVTLLSEQRPEEDRRIAHGLRNEMLTPSESG